MPKAHSLALLITMMGVVMVLSSVDAQSTVDDSASCESSSLDEAVNVIREDLKDVKKLLGSNQQQNSESAISKKDLEDLKASMQQQCRRMELSCSSQDPASSLSCEYRNVIRHVMRFG